MASGDSSLGPFVIRMREQWRQKVNPEQVAQAAAAILVRELMQSVPGPGEREGATGNMMSALATTSDVWYTGNNIAWIGVGDLKRLGTPTEKMYEPEPIRRFLDWYRQRADQEYEQRRIAEKERAAQRAIAKAERAALKAEADKLARKVENRRKIISSIRDRERNQIDRLYKLHELNTRWGRLTGYLNNYYEYIARTPGWDPHKKSYFAKQEKINKLQNRLAGVNAEIEALKKLIEKKSELLVEMKAHYGVSGKTFYRHPRVRRLRRILGEG